MPLTWQAWQHILRIAGAIAGAAVAGYVAHRVIYWMARRWVRREGKNHHQILVSAIAQPFGVILPILLVLAAVPIVPVSARVEAPAHHFLVICLIAACAWLLIRLAGYAEAVIARRYQIGAADDLLARRVQTQVRLFRRLERPRFRSLLWQ